MRNPVIVLMIVVVIGFLASHAIMVAVSVGSDPSRLEASGRTPDLGAPKGTRP